MGNHALAASPPKDDDAPASNGDGFVEIRKTAKPRCVDDQEESPISGPMFFATPVAPSAPTDQEDERGRFNDQADIAEFEIGLDSKCKPTVNTKKCILFDIGTA